MRKRTILSDFLNQALLVHMNTAKIRLIVLFNVHEAKHGFTAFTHAVVAVATTSGARLSVTGND